MRLPRTLMLTDLPNCCLFEHGKRDPRCDGGLQEERCSAPTRSHPRRWQRLQEDVRRAVFRAFKSKADPFGWASSPDVVRAQLGLRGALVSRYNDQQTKTAFLVCSCWPVEARRSPLPITRRSLGTTNGLRAAVSQGCFKATPQCCASSVLLVWGRPA